MGNDISIYASGNTRVGGRKVPRLYWVAGRLHCSIHGLRDIQNNGEKAIAIVEQYKGKEALSHRQMEQMLIGAYRQGSMGVLLKWVRMQ